MDNRTYGYIRVSSTDQNENRQMEALLAEGIDKRNIKMDKASGKDFNRKGYNSLVGTDDVDGSLREGDLLVILSIDRLGRNYEEIMVEWKRITQSLKANIKVLDMPLLDTSKSGNDLDTRFVADLVLQILSYVAQKERENIRSRQRQGIDVMPIVDGKRTSTKTGNPHGRPQAEFPENWQEIYDQWKASAMTAVQAFTQLGLTKNTFYNLVKRYENNQQSK